MEKMTVEQIQLRREALQSLEDNPTFQSLLDKLKVQQQNKRREQREAAFKQYPDVVFGCEWALWGLEQTQTILSRMRDELKERTEKTLNY